MRRTFALVGAALLAGCGGGPLADAAEGPLKEALAECDAFGAPVADWCALQVLEKNEGSTGESVAAVCRRIGERDARDWCYESAVRAKPPLAPPETCRRIHTDTVRESCLLTVADRLVAQEADAEAIMDVCTEMGALRRFCVYHLVQERVGYFRRNGGTDRLLADVRYVLERDPGSAEAPGLGAATARVACALQGGPPLRGDQVCGLFPEGPARSGCLTAAAGGECATAR